MQYICYNYNNKIMTDQLISLGTSLIAGVATEVLPFDSISVRMSCGLFLAELIRSPHLITKTKFLSRWFANKEITIDSEHDSIYCKMELYLTSKFKDQINTCSILPNNGSIMLGLSEHTFNKPLVDKFEHHEINIKVERSDKSYKFILSSKTATLDDIKKYINNIINTISLDNSIDMYTTKTADISNNSKNAFLESKWKLTRISTNKKFSNTIVSDSVNREFLQDVKWFMDNNSWYAEKGIPYKRGYVLYGPPGTGKTSLIKSIANEYNMSVFIVNLNDIMDNENLVTLIADINYYAGTNKHILVFEDIDRSLCISDQRYSRVSMGCLINVLDGLMESNGRIVIMTANNVGLIKQHDVLVRPGRIDKFVEIGYCDKKQAINISKLFFKDMKIDEKKLDFGTNVTTASLISLMQEHNGKPKEVLDYLYGKNKIVEVEKPVDTTDKLSLDFRIRLMKNNIKNELRSYDKQIKTLSSKKRMLDKDDKVIDNGLEQLKKKQKLVKEKTKNKKTKQKNKN